MLGVLPNTLSHTRLAHRSSAITEHSKNTSDADESLPRLVKIINVPFFSVLEIDSQIETTVEIKTFVEVSDNINKVAKWEWVVFVL